MTGWDYNADMEIAAVPAPELASIDTMNPDEDTRKAISYHPTIISLRGTNGHGDVNRGIKERSLEDTENKINTRCMICIQRCCRARSPVMALQVLMRAPV